MKYAQLVIGPAGSGKSKYCATIHNHALATNRHVFMVNLDPACEVFDYPASVDVRDLISVADVLEDDELQLGPNGALVFCMEFLAKNLDWLSEQLDPADDDYFIFDLPGQIELYLHLPVMRQIVDALREWDFSVCSVFMVDTQFVLEPEKFIGGSMTALSSMILLETPNVNVLSKMDLLTDAEKTMVEEMLETDIRTFIDNCDETPWNLKHRQLSKGIADVLEEYSLVKFLPLDITDEDNIADVLLTVDMSMGYGEDLEVRDRYPEEQDLDAD